MNHHTPHTPTPGTAEDIISVAGACAFDTFDGEAGLGSARLTGRGMEWGCQEDSSTPSPSDLRVEAST